MLAGERELHFDENVVTNCQAMQKLEPLNSQQCLPKKNGFWEKNMIEDKQYTKTQLKLIAIVE